ncbi:LPS export ABC transporter periplasmic protein LptC [Roseovarius aestuariivivens]|uniref:LPS export ABC transporter periplasmic protein LptC n=1 Tax=Roseovarius aestuariivivens TaxID=1888910 RepID=UPI00108041AD|nr:LPS export ABC transporter periplasmic protein LptC [Roseovarius aestuariivivens]
MALQDNFYSRFVAWMKIILPLAALGILSTLFLISRSVDPTKAIPFSEIDLAQRAQDQGATNASFAGVTSGGDEVRLLAETARPDPEDPRLINAESVTAEIVLLSGTRIDIASQRADLHQNRYTATLDGDVEVTTTTGYEIRTKRLEAKLDTLYAETPGPVTGTGPPGDLSAGRMILQGNETTGDAHLLFTDGVKLVYTRKVAEE